MNNDEMIKDKVEYKGGITLCKVIALTIIDDIFKSTRFIES